MAIGDSQARNRLTVITVYGVYDNLLVNVIQLIMSNVRALSFDRPATVTSIQHFVTCHGRTGLPRLESNHQIYGFLTLYVHRLYIFIAIYL